MTAAGYLSGRYAESFAEVGDARRLPRSGGWIIERSPAEELRDAMGIYPILCCADWSGLQEDLSELEDRLVSLVVVTDPHGRYDLNLLQQSFNAVVRPYKAHLVTDLAQDPADFVHPSHRRNARRALRLVNVEAISEPLHLADQWWSLYQILVERHRIRSLVRFSRAAFAIQLSVPGIRAYRAMAGNETRSMSLWYVQGDVAYYHLGASSDAGYRDRAAFAVFWKTIEDLRSGGVRWLSLGAAPGPNDDGRSGLGRFKSGWATDTRMTYLCGSIWKRDVYDRLSAASGLAGPDYFPAYRAGEFG